MKNNDDICEKNICGIRTVNRKRVEKAFREAVNQNELSRLALIFKILGDPTRLKIVLALRGGEMCVCDIAAFLNITESATSHQLRRLRDFALVKNRRQGQILYYSLDDDHVCAIVQTGLDHVLE